MYIEEAKFSLWCDFLERDFLDNGFKELLENKIVNGATSNPAIFKSAFLTSPAYQDDIEKLKGKNPKEIYEALAIKDIRKCADMLTDLYQQNDDGFVSIEVDPFLCDDAKGTIEEAKRLYQEIAKKNVMIKIPATDAGFIAMEKLISEGMNINATLIFSPRQAESCLNAFEKGTKKFLEKNKNSKVPKAVISVFVSRFDRKMDEALFERNIRGGLVGIMNATKIYHMIEKRALDNVRTLFASTGVKGDSFKPDYYVKNLLYKNSINTAPLDTIKAFVDTKNYEVIETPLSNDRIEEFFDVVKNQGFDMEKVYHELMQEGLVAFKDAFEEILNTFKG